MRDRRRRSDDLFAGAFSKARWMCRDALSRRSWVSASELLLAHAAEIAGSFDGRDQLLSLALSAGVADIVAGRKPLDTFPSVTVHRGRRTTRAEWNAVAKGNAEACEAAARLAADISDKAAQSECGMAVRRSLRDIAALQEALWRSPEIPADNNARMVMLLSAPLILDKSKKHVAARAGLRLFAAGQG
ncbi:MAG: hypothetical protein RIE56_13435 [Amphiplicatus sp.]